MLEPYYTNKFEKDIKKIQRRGKDLKKIKEVIAKLISEDELAQSNRDHNLTGDLIGHRECHIEPDWILIYKIKL